MASRLLFFLVSFFFVLYANAAQGLFMVVKGDVKVTSSGNTTAARVGTKVQVGDLVATGKDSRAKIVMTDRNVINVSPETQMKIEEYTSTEQSKNVKLSLLNGKIRNNVEQKYDNDKNKFEVRTPTAVAGVRGTQFITSYSEANKTTEVITLRGSVEFRTLTTGGESSAPGEGSASQTVVVAQGETSSVSDESAKPEPPQKIPQQELREIERDSTVRNRETPAQQENRRQPPPPPPRPPNAEQTRPPIIDGAIENKFDKTKVKVEPRPPSGTQGN
jgi:FecR protein